jgi:hypothetical protein
MKAFIVILLVAIAGYFGYRYFSKSKPAPAATETSVPTETTETPVVVAERKTTTSTNPAVTALVREVKTKPVTKPQPTGEGKQKMEAILASTASPEAKVQQIRDLLSKLSELEAEQAVQALTHAVKDDSFGFIKPLVVDPTLPEPVRDEFMVDLMNRPNSIRIPLFLEIARNPDHPDHENTYDTLEIFTGMKYGADWNAWEKGIDTWLKENPDRPRQPQAPAQVN